MPFLGVEPVQEFASVAKQTITGTGATAYSLDHSVASANDLAVFVNNVRQEPTSAYTASGGTITFTSALASTDSCYVMYIARTFSSASVEANSIGITELNVSDGTSGQALTTDGSGTLSFSTISAAETNDLTSAVTWANVPDANITQSSVTQHQAALSITESQISDLGTIQAVASGTLANGETVIMNSNGTVSGITETPFGGPTVAGTPAIFNSSSVYNITAAYDSNAQKVIIVYRDSGNSNYGTAIVGTVSGTSISFGTPAVFNSNTSYFTDIVYDSNAQKVVISYRDGGNSDYGTAVVGTVSGTSISFGSATVFESNNTTYISSTYDSNAQKVVIVYKEDGVSDYGKAIVGTVSGTSISFGTAAVFESAAIFYTACTYDSNAQKVVIAYRDSGNSSYGTAIVGTVSGTSISFGTAVVFESGSTSYVYADYDSNAQKVVIGYTDSGNSLYGTAIVGTVSGTSISFGTAVVFDTTGNGTYPTTVYDSNAQKVVIAYSHADSTTSTDVGNLVVGTVSGTSISFSAPFEYSVGPSDYPSAVYDSSAQKVVIAYLHRNEAFISSTKGIVIETLSSSTSLTSGNYIGISNAAYSNGATATIQIAGSVDDAQSGLTPGNRYFIQKDGSLGLTAITPEVVAGTAISSTELIVKG
jgi:hypothetical protein